MYERTGNWSHPYIKTEGVIPRTLGINFLFGFFACAASPLCDLWVRPPQLHKTFQLPSSSASHRLCQNPWYWFFQTALTYVRSQNRYKRASGTSLMVSNHCQRRFSLFLIWVKGKGIQRMSPKHLNIRTVDNCVICQYFLNLIFCLHILK